MPKMRHPTMRFNFTPPGDVFETTDDCVQYLIDTYGCELVGDYIPPPEPEPAADVVEAYETTSTEDEVDEVEDVEPGAPAAQYVEVIDLPIKGKAGWYEWEGKKYRKNNLPAEASALLE